MLSFINVFNLSLFVLFTLLYIYQIVYAGVALVHKPREYRARKLHRYAVIIAARNESAVIGELIRSIKRQDYPSELLDIVVVADNCTDDTAEVARRAGATLVYERFNKQLVGKGYALDYVLKRLYAEHADKRYEGYFVFDADNLLAPNYVSEMNKVFDNGYRVVTCYRNSKNYDSNWLSAGYSLWFLREAKYLNNARMILGSSCAISGTGFLVHDDIIRKNGGWKHHLLTEDIEFSVDNVIQGEIIGYAHNARIYDEQPREWKQAWNQRLRWSKGFYQVFGKYGAKLVKTAVARPSFSCFDMLMTIAPALFITLLSIMVNLSFLVSGLINYKSMPEMIPVTLGAVFTSVTNFYLVLFGFGLLTTITEWKQINSTPAKKIFYMFTFPIFIFTYAPIAIVALFKKIEWKPITHNIVKRVEEIHP